MIEGKEVSGYTNEKDVKPDSKTETFVAAKLFIDNWRWKDVPFYLRTGKRLSRKNTEIAITFKKVPHSMFAAYRPCRYACKCPGIADSAGRRNYA